VVKLWRRPSVEDARKAGSSIAKVRGQDDVLILGGQIGRMEDVAIGVALRSYTFTPHKTGNKDTLGKIEMMVAAPDDLKAVADIAMAVAQGVLFTRDLTNEPANVLTTTEFANRLVDLENLGMIVEVLEEDALERLGMGSLLCVGVGSASPSKVVVMQWNGGGDEAPIALVGKGVVFDTGGISLKPAGGMEDMTMDMGGAGVVAGVMKTLALRKAKANVVGLVGLVENMPSDRATRPGDVVTSMKGDTIEVINTDAEGRLVLADVVWYAQERFKPTGLINLATLTGAVIVALGHENAGVFSNNDELTKDYASRRGRV
jgi:leucyl aminopeptidase